MGRNRGYSEFNASRKEVLWKQHSKRIYHRSPKRAPQVSSQPLGPHGREKQLSPKVGAFHDQKCNYRQKGEQYYKTRNKLCTCVGPNRSLKPTRTRAAFSVKREVTQGSMLRSNQVLGDYSKNVNETAVQNGARGLTPNR